MDFGPIYYGQISHNPRRNNNFLRVITYKSSSYEHPYIRIIEGYFKGIFIHHFIELY